MSLPVFCYGYTSLAKARICGVFPISRATPDTRRPVIGTPTNMVGPIWTTSFLGDLRVEDLFGVIDFITTPPIYNRLGNTKIELEYTHDIL